MRLTTPSTQRNGSFGYVPGRSDGLTLLLRVNSLHPGAHAARSLSGGCPTSLTKTSYDAHCPLGQCPTHQAMAKSAPGKLQLLGSPREALNSLMYTRSKVVAGIDDDPAECRRWVISGPRHRPSRCPLYPNEQTSLNINGRSEKCHKRTHAPQYRLVVLQIEFAGMDRSSLQSSSALRVAAPVISTVSALDVDACYEPFNLAVIADQPQTRTRRTRQPWPS
jgi:hypothetical protein